MLANSVVSSSRSRRREAVPDNPMFGQHLGGTSCSNSEEMRKKRLLALKQVPTDDDTHDSIIIAVPKSTLLPQSFAEVNRTHRPNNSSPQVLGPGKVFDEFVYPGLQMAKRFFFFAHTSDHVVIIDKLEYV